MDRNQWAYPAPESALQRRAHMTSKCSGRILCVSGTTCILLARSMTVIITPPRPLLSAPPPLAGPPLPVPLPAQFLEQLRALSNKFAMTCRIRPPSQNLTALSQSFAIGFRHSCCQGQSCSVGNLFCSSRDGSSIQRGSSGSDRGCRNGRHST